MEQIIVKVVHAAACKLSLEVLLQFLFLPDQDQRHFIRQEKVGTQISVRIKAAQHEPFEGIGEHLRVRVGVQLSMEDFQAVVGPGAVFVGGRTASTHVAHGFCYDKTVL